MYNFYKITLSGSNEINLTYQLESHSVAQSWATLMQSAYAKNLRPTLNPWRNFDKNALPNKIVYLEQLVEKLNSWLPEHNKIKGKWDYNDHQTSVNRFHKHFPEQEKNETDVERRSQLTEFNDLIHEIELLAKTQYPQPRLLLCVDGVEMRDLVDEEYKLFTAKRFFGELCLHYCHVGRHPFEIYRAKDFNCPIDQILPQKFVSVLHTLRFYNDPLSEEEHWFNFKKFYEHSTLKEVYDLNDPKIAFGYITLGKLVSNKSEIEVFNEVSQCNKVIDWKVY